MATPDFWAIGRLVLMVHAYRRIDRLAPETQADLRAAIGLPIAHEEVLEREPVRESWLVAGQRIDQEDRLRVQRTWLVGSASGRQAMILDFAVGTAGFKNNLLPGSVVEADLCYFRAHLRFAGW